ncbi:MAG: aminoacetone oxidase family FAD-binding enzyme [Clostridia bacterium]|nr:aminoacetone oxidase family FAD-binding enzyme [Clostridia bacterium]
MQKIYQTVIVGGGVSGLACAVELLGNESALLGENVLILERNDRVGKKLIATGNGQGNLMNQKFNKEFYHGEKSFVCDFIDNAFKVDLESYLNDLGIPLYTSKDGKKYPLSRQASSVLDVLRANLMEKGCQIKTDSKVVEIEKKADLFLVKTQSEQYLSKTVVMATGGCAGKQFGTDGSSYSLAQKFGHRLTPLFPSLVQLKTETNLIKGLKGIKELARVTAEIDGKEITSATGDLLFTEYGVSGNTIFQISSAFSGRGNESVKIEFLPELSFDQVQEILKKREKLSYLKNLEPLNGVIVKRLGQAVVKTAKSNSSKDVAYALKNFRLKVTGNTGFNYAQVTKGGISTSDINSKTMESKLQKNFYLIGETVDVDGDCGGYNVTFAFVTGIVCAKAIKNKLK